jgi:hypothetical protein
VVSVYEAVRQRLALVVVGVFETEWGGSEGRKRGVVATDGRS